jgi:hypothetical protein
MASNAFRRLAPLIPLTAVLALSLAATRGASANEAADHRAAARAHAAHAWTLAWRPNWLPWDPPSDPASDESFPTFLSAATSAPGLMIAIDPVTKRPVAPTLEQRRAWAEAMQPGGALGAPAAPNAPLRVEKIRGGGEITYLDGRFQVYMVARRDAKGRIVTDEAPSYEAAKQLVAQPAPARAREER